MVFMTKSNMTLAFYVVYFFGLFISLNSLPVNLDKGESSEKIPSYSNCNPASLPNMIKNISLNSLPVNLDKGESSEKIPSYSNCNPASLSNMIKNMSFNRLPIKICKDGTTEKISSSKNLPLSIQKTIKNSPLPCGDSNELPQSIINLRNNVIKQVLKDCVAVDVGCVKNCLKQQLDPDFNHVAFLALDQIKQGDLYTARLYLINIIKKSLPKEESHSQPKTVDDNINQVIMTFTNEVHTEIREKFLKKTTALLTLEKLSK